MGSAVSQVKPNGGGEWISDSDPGQEKVSSEKIEEEAVLVTSGGDDVIMGLEQWVLLRRHLRQVRVSFLPQ